jgi:hypothetical protein
MIAEVVLLSQKVVKVLTTCFKLWLQARFPVAWLQFPPWLWLLPFSHFWAAPVMARKPRMARALNCIVLVIGI